MPLDLIVRNGLVTTTALDRQPLEVGVADGRIARLAPRIEDEAHATIDAGGKHVFPGFIDPHTHMELPVSGTVSCDDFYTGTVAAACGGITTIIDFAGAVRGQSLTEAMETWHARARPKVTIDYGLHMIVPELDEWQLAEIPDLVAGGISTLKCMMAYKRGPQGSGDANLMRVIWKAKETGALPMVHAENGDAIDVGIDRLHAQGHTAPRWHPRSRPSMLEAEAVNRAATLAALADMPMYIVHLSSGAALDAVRAARDRGWAVLAETCPQYLTLTEEEYERPGFEAAKYICSPPLRSAADRSALWSGIERGDFQVIASDHCPFNYHGQKDMGRDDFARIPNGIPTIQPMFGLVFSQGVHEGRMTLQEFVGMSSTNAARIFGMYPRKGEIAVGSDADVVIFDPDRSVRLTTSFNTGAQRYRGPQSVALRERVDYTPYEGFELTGWPHTVISRGEVVVRAGEPTEALRSGRGQFIPRGSAQLA